MANQASISSVLLLLASWPCPAYRSPCQSGSWDCSAVPDTTSLIQTSIQVRSSTVDRAGVATAQARASGLARPTHAQTHTLHISDDNDTAVGFKKMVLADYPSAGSTKQFSELFPSAAHLEDLDARYAASAKAATQKHSSWLATDCNLTGDERKLRKDRLRMFNPSVFLDAHGSMQLLARISTASRCCGDSFCDAPLEELSYRSVVKCPYGPDLTQCSQPLPDLDDPHGFNLNGRSYFLANSYKFHWLEPFGQEDFEECSMKLVDFDTFAISQLKLPNASSCEKNWAPFIENGTLFMTYALSPRHQVLRCDITKESPSCEFAHSSEASLTEQGLPSSPNMSSIHGGTPYVELDDKHMLALAHIYDDQTWYDDQGHSNLKRSYWHSFYTIERQRPYRLVANTPWFQFPNLESDRSADWRGVQYAGGLTYNKDGDLIVSFGVGDCHSRSLRMHTGDIKQSLIM